MRTQTTSLTLARSPRRWTFALAIAAAVAATEATPTIVFAQPASQDVQKATAAFQEGKKLFDAKKFPQALDQFTKSYQLVASPNSHIYIARCQAEMGNLKDAFHTFQAVIIEADLRSKTEPKYVPTRDSAKTELNDLETKIGVVTVTVQSDNPAARAKMNGQLVPREEYGKEQPVDPGVYDFTLEIPGSETATQHVTIVKGQKQAITLAPPTVQANLPPPPPPPTKHKKLSPFVPVGIAFGVVGVGGFIMFAVEGAASSSTFSDLQTRCGQNGPCGDATNNDLIDKGKTQQLVANVGLGIGVVGVAAAGTFFVLAAVSKPKADTALVKPEPQVGFDIGPSYAGVHGTF
jgi:hypothetical protein